jgi:hypothetical protein
MNLRSPRVKQFSTYLASARQHRNVVVSGFLQNLKPLDSCTRFEHRSLPSLPLIIRKELDFLEIVRPDIQRAGSARLANVIVSRVLDNKSQIVIPRKVQAQLNVRDAAYIHGVVWVPAECTSGIVGVRCGHACAALEEGPHVGGWVACTVDF